MSFAARQVIKGLLSALSAGAVYWALLHGDDFLHSSFGRAYPLLALFLFSVGMSMFSAFGASIVYHFQAAFAAPPGSSLSSSEFAQYLGSAPRFALYLRNFRSEKGAFATPRLIDLCVAYRPSLMWIPETDSNLEFLLYNSLSKHVHLIAIENRRADTIPYFDTVHCDDDEWQAIVRTAAAKACVVILAVEAETPGLKVEFEIIHTVALQRTWLISTAAIRGWLLTTPNSPLGKTRWQTEVAEGQSLRSISSLSVPSGVINFCRGEV